jgi:hypothetical protein
MQRREQRRRSVLGQWRRTSADLEQQPDHIAGPNQRGPMHRRVAVRVRELDVHALPKQPLDRARLVLVGRPEQSLQLFELGHVHRGARA